MRPGAAGNPWDDRTDHAGRLARRADREGVTHARYRVTVILRCSAAVKFEYLDDCTDFALCRRDRLAVIAHFEPREFVRAFGDQLRHFEQHLSAARRRKRGPFSAVERPPRRSNGGVDITLCSFGHVRDDFARGGVRSSYVAPETASVHLPSMKSCVVEAVAAVVVIVVP